MQSLGAVNQANSKELKPLMARLDTVLRSMLADFGKDKMGAVACLRMSSRTLHLPHIAWHCGKHLDASKCHVQCLYNVQEYSQR